MKILMCSFSGYGAWFMLRLIEEGHKVDYYLMDKKFQNILGGIVPEPKFKKPDFKKYDLVIFDFTSREELAEEAAAVTNVLGNSEIASRLESDRLFGIEIMAECGIEIPDYEVFDSIDEAKKFVKKSNKRYVFKPNGVELEKSSTYVSHDAEDLIDYLDRLEQVTKGVEFILQEVVQGTEVSTEAYFNGEEFYFVNATLEEKKFMEGGKGPNTGCSGNLVWIYQDRPKIFRQGLEKLKPFLQTVGYRGMIDLNTIANNSHLYGIEWTPRFGYDASATCFSLYNGDLGEFFHKITSGQPINVEVNNPFAAAVRLTIPPYPSECDGYYRELVPINGIEPEDMEHIYMYDAMLQNDCLVTVGAEGFIASPMGTGRTIEEAFAQVDARIKKIKIPDLQYRRDIYKTTKKRYEELSAMGWLK